MTAICGETESRNWIVGTLGFTAGTVGLGAAAFASSMLMRTEALTLVFGTGSALSLVGMGAMGYVAAHKLRQADCPVSAVAVGIFSTMMVATGLPVAGFLVRIGMGI